jgi:hypothetical protein
LSLCKKELTETLSEEFWEQGAGVRNLFPVYFMAVLFKLT